VAQLLDLSAFESAGMAVIDVLEGGRDFELGLLEAGDQRPVGSPQPLPLHQQRQTLFEVQIEDVGIAALFLQGLDHALQAEGPQLVHGGMGQHKPGSFHAK
jgi:hypothetical protein